MIVIPASLRSDFIHMAGMTIHIALESTIHIVGIRRYQLLREFRHGLRQECVALSFRSGVATILWASRTSGPSG